MILSYAAWSLFKKEGSASCWECAGRPLLSALFGDCLRWRKPPPKVPPTCRVSHSPVTDQSSGYEGLAPHPILGQLWGTILASELPGGSRSFCWESLTIQLLPLPSPASFPFRSTRVCPDKHPLHESQLSVPSWKPTCCVCKWPKVKQYRQCAKENKPTSICGCFQRWSCVC